jgi:hypothetical protein
MTRWGGGTRDVPGEVISLLDLLPGAYLSDFGRIEGRASNTFFVDVCRCRRTVDEQGCLNSDV